MKDKQKIGLGCKAQDICELISTRSTTTHCCNINKFHDKNIDALHSLKIADRKLRCLNAYKKLGKSNMYEWFIEVGEIKAKYSHVEACTSVKNKRHNLPILENHLC